MFHTVYRTTNLVNGKFYIGVHKTEEPNDSYLGSGKYLQRAVKKYGVENFKKEVLFVFDEPQQAFDKEEEFVELHRSDPNCYNLRKGGAGGFDFINRNGLHNTAPAREALKKLWEADPESKIRFTQRGRIGRLNSMAWKLSMKSKKNDHFKGRKHTEETRQQMRDSAKNVHSGSRNSQFGTCWITRDNESKKIKKSDLDAWIQLGWIQGRTYRP
jgi:group I intron endonuclease